VHILVLIFHCKPWKKSVKLTLLSVFLRFPLTFDVQLPIEEKLLFCFFDGKIGELENNLWYLCNYTYMVEKNCICNRTKIKIDPNMHIYSFMAIIKD
jgi:hypothetical protein